MINFLNCLFKIVMYENLPFRFMLLADFDAYIKCQDRVSEVFKVSVSGYTFNGMIHSKSRK